MHLRHRKCGYLIGFGLLFSICHAHAYAPQQLAMAKISSYFFKSSTVNEDLYEPSIKAAPVVTKIEPKTGNKLGNYVVHIYGDNLLDVQMVKFGNLPVLKLNVENNHHISVVIPGQVSGPVSIEVYNDYGLAHVNNGFNYVDTEIGQLTSGGVVGCLKADGGPSNLIVSNQDNVDKVSWSGISSVIGALSHLNGKNNSYLINQVLEKRYGRYAAHICKEYAVNSSGDNCVPGTEGCYNDWFLPAIDQLDCLYVNKDKIKGFKHDNYWSSTEFNAEKAWYESFRLGRPYTLNEFGFISVRCVREFYP